MNNQIRSDPHFGANQFTSECGKSCFQTVWLDALDFDSVTGAPRAAVLAVGNPGPDDRAVADTVTAGRLDLSPTIERGH